jgi:hypothetical protein
MCCTLSAWATVLLFPLNGDCRGVKPLRPCTGSVPWANTEPAPQHEDGIPSHPPTSDENQPWLTPILGRVLYRLQYYTPKSPAPSLVDIRLAGHCLAHHKSPVASADAYIARLGTPLRRIYPFTSPRSPPLPLIYVRPRSPLHHCSASPTPACTSPGPAAAQKAVPAGPNGS